MPVIVSVYSMDWDTFKKHMRLRHPELWNWTRYEHDRQHELDEEIEHDHEVGLA